MLNNATLFKSLVGSVFSQAAYLDDNMADWQRVLSLNENASTEYLTSTIYYHTAYLVTAENHSFVIYENQVPVAIWPLTLDGLGKFTKTASALLIMAISGGAIIPPLYGRIVDANKHELISSGLQEADAMASASTSSYWILIPCYAIVLFFAVWGHKIKNWTKK